MAVYRPKQVTLGNRSRNVLQLQTVITQSNRYLREHLKSDPDLENKELSAEQSLLNITKYNFFNNKVKCVLNVTIYFINNHELFAGN